MKKKSGLSRYWKANSTNQIASLIITLVLCIWAGKSEYLFSLPVWVILGVVFWVIRMCYISRQWNRDHPEKDDG